jgi:hypothetical protein
VPNYIAVAILASPTLYPDDESLRSAVEGFSGETDFVIDHPGNGWAILTLAPAQSESPEALSQRVLRAVAVLKDMPGLQNRALKDDQGVTHLPPSDAPKFYTGGRLPPRKPGPQP